jgi:hypothetical protein
MKLCPLQEIKIVTEKIFDGLEIYNDGINCFYECAWLINGTCAIAMIAKALTPEIKKEPEGLEFQ